MDERTLALSPEGAHEADYVNLLWVPLQGQFNVMPVLCRC